MADSLQLIISLILLLNKNLPLRIWPNRPFRPKQMRTKIFLVPVKEVCHVNLTFPMEDLSSFWAEAPAAQVAQLIGHKGEGGLYALLRRKGWAHQLVVITILFIAIFLYKDQMMYSYNSPKRQA